ncbi:hypothetical protein J2Y45_003729 [Dyadobacter sp. BE34]|uniref:YD repeat protein n=1 Tax=Dyadobacter fermentans TaxID=94254 RepID=A0ABU1QZW0_9BACT|nr:MULTISPECIES: hypothetical protein [Dyadobacter]MDR6806537.1 hypothetical protein [Dyadobacter fermentans]MDR7044278.1 hypothetical protein [Dyadobacter sp. BE242]MDR7198589.1 hypothetical protein [Dyadobacter sp. BE34]MDR7216551.1 hypothetical protein [Dyadobacter sp. BE31]MDR7263923.1 hypothetical protein [Dyadobacter sp. BE32]
MQILKLSFRTVLAIVAGFIGCTHSVDPVEEEWVLLIQNVKRPDIEAIKRKSITPAGALDKVITEVDGEQYANAFPGARQYLYDSTGRLVGFADQLLPKNSPPGLCDVIYEYKDDKIFRLYYTIRGEGYWADLDSGLRMLEFAYDRHNRITKAYTYHVDGNGLARMDEDNTYTLQYDNEGRLTELRTTGTTYLRTIYQYSGKNLHSSILTYNESEKVLSECRSEYKYDHNANGLRSLPEIPKLFHPGRPLFDQLFGENNLVAMKSVSNFFSENMEATEYHVEYKRTFDETGRTIEKVADYKDNTPTSKSRYYYK